MSEFGGTFGIFQSSSTAGRLSQVDKVSSQVAVDGLNVLSPRWCRRSSAFGLDRTSPQCQIPEQGAISGAHATPRFASFSSLLSCVCGGERDHGVLYRADSDPTNSLSSHDRANNPFRVACPGIQFTKVFSVERIDSELSVKWMSLASVFCVSERTGLVCSRARRP